MKNKHFFNLANNLKKHGYRVRVKKIKYNGKFQCWFATHGKKSTGIQLGFSDETINADNIKCFDKWQKCPICLPIPTTKKEFNVLLDKLKFLASEEGYKWSNSYEYLNEVKNEHE